MKSFNRGTALEKEHGTLRAKKIRIRMTELRAAECLKDFWPPKSPPTRCHELNLGKRRGKYHFSVDLDHPYRLIFIPDYDVMPILEDGGLDWSQITAIKILGIEDTHE